MVSKKKVFTLRYGESNENDMLVRLNFDDTLLENLTNIIPAAVQRGYLPKECTPENVRVVYDKKVLNLNLSLQEQAPDIKEREILVIRDISSTVRLRIRYKPDKIGERVDSIYISPYRTLGDELSKFFQKASSEHRYNRRKAKRFKIYSGRKRLKLNKTLNDQGFEAGFDARMEPRIIFRWPPGIYAITTACLILAALLVFLVLKISSGFKEINTFYITFLSDTDCQLVFNDSTTYALEGSKSTTIRLGKGLHTYQVRPKDYPIFYSQLGLDPKKAKKDSLMQEIRIVDRFSDSEKINFTINGYWDKMDNKIEDRLMINGYERRPNEFGDIKTELPKGIYEMKFDIPSGLLRYNDMKLESNVFRPDTFLFDFSKLRGNEYTLTFPYSRKEIK